jgi:hypothetical protein
MVPHHAKNSGEINKWRPHWDCFRYHAAIEPKGEGGIHVNSRHNRGAGFAADLEKYLEASLAGWRVVRLGPGELTSGHIGRLFSLVCGGPAN